MEKKLFLLTAGLSVSFASTTIILSASELLVTKHFTKHIEKFLPSIFLVLSNCMILLSVMYITACALKKTRARWTVSCNYLLYVIWELISVVTAFSCYHELALGVYIVVLVIALFWALLLFNFFAIRVLPEPVYRMKHVRESSPVNGTKGGCFTVHLQEATTSNQA